MCRRLFSVDGWCTCNLRPLIGRGVRPPAAPSFDVVRLSWYLRRESNIAVSSRQVNVVGLNEETTLPTQLKLNLGCAIPPPKEAHTHKIKKND